MILHLIENQLNVGRFLKLNQIADLTKPLASSRYDHFSKQRGGLSLQTQGEML